VEYIRHVDITIGVEIRLLKKYDLRSRRLVASGLFVLSEVLCLQVIISSHTLLPTMFVRTSQLLFLATAVFVRRVTAEANQIGIAFSGGGFKSVSDQVRRAASFSSSLLIDRRSS